MLLQLHPYLDGAFDGKVYLYDNGLMAGGSDTGSSDYSGNLTDSKCTINNIILLLLQTNF